MRRFVILAALVVAAPLLISCSQALEARVTGTLERPVLSFGVPGETKAQRVCIDTVLVAEAASYRPVWEAGGTDVDCIEVAAVTYGEAPSGLPVSHQPERLRADTVYAFSGGGWTHSFPNVPWMSGRPGARVVFHDGAWRPTSR